GGLDRRALRRRQVQDEPPPRPALGQHQELPARRRATVGAGTRAVARVTPSRIVSLIPSTTELLCHLGLAGALVGITAYCREPAALLPGKRRVGGEKDPDLDAIRALSPDLVIANVEENVREHVEILRGWGIAVHVTYPRTVAGALAMIRELGRVTGTRARADALADDLQARLDQVHALTVGRPPARVFYAIWREPYM